MIVVGTRDADLDPIKAGRLSELGRAADSSRLRLRSLDSADVGTLVSDLVGSTAGRDLAESIASATEGNPFFIEEMTVHLIDSGMIVDGGDGLSLKKDPSSAGVPERVRDTLTRRLLSVSSDGIELLTIGSLIGREFDISSPARPQD